VNAHFGTPVIGADQQHIGAGTESNFLTMRDIPDGQCPHSAPKDPHADVRRIGARPSTFTR
jgi:hypothetical protein